MAPKLDEYDYNRKKLTICIPTYNRKEKLISTIKKLVPQLSSQVELFISNNASTDGTLDAISPYSNFLCINNNDDNIGASQNILKCLNLGRGEYIWILNDDDDISSAAVQRVLEGINCYAPVPLLWASARLLNIKHADKILSSTDNWVEITAEGLFFSIGCWITFCPSIIVRRQSIAHKAFFEALGTSLTSTAITMHALSLENRVAVSRYQIVDPQESELGRYDVFSIFTRNLRLVCQQYSDNPFLPSSLEYVYRDSFYTVLDGRIHTWPLSLKAILNMFRYGYRYKKLYTVYVPAIAKRLVIKCLWFLGPKGNLGKLSNVLYVNLSLWFRR